MAESIFTKDEILRREYEQREKAIMDYNSAMNAAQRIGREEGFEQGFEEGLEKGLEEGIKKVALSMLDSNAPIDLISKYTGLTIETIKSLRQSN